MKFNLLERLRAQKAATRKRRRNSSLLVCLSLLVALGTLLSLIHPAIAMSQDACVTEEHTHSEACYTEGVLVCQLAEHAHSEACQGPEGIPAVTYICGLEEHTHDDDCVAPEGLLNCWLAEHAHSDACIAPSEEVPPTEAPTPGQLLGEQIAALPDIATFESTLNSLDEAGDYDGFEAYYIDTITQVLSVKAQYATLSEEEKLQVGNVGTLNDYAPYAEMSLYANEVFYCGMEAHIHTESCYDDFGNLVCPETAHIHTSLCEVEPSTGGGSTADPEDSLIGKRWYHNHNKALYYQSSSFNITYADASDSSTGSSSAHPFVLVTECDTWDSSSWVPKPGTTWTAKTDANYEVAYCVDWRTKSSENGAIYSAIPLESSKFTDKNVQRTLAGIVANTYPFLTESEVQDKLKKAYQNGEISSDLSGCSADEFIAATQWAIWEVTTLGSAKFGTSQRSSISTTKCLNKSLTKAHSGASHVGLIKNWLLKQQAPAKLEISSHNVSAQASSISGVFDVSVDVSLNRAVTADETITYQLTVGSKVGQLHLVPAGSKTFTATLPEGVTQSDLQHGASIHISVAGSHMQAYIFNNSSYQDMIGANYEDFSYSIDFKLGSSERTSVNVSKVWSETPTVSSVSVQLMANGLAFGDPVSLSSSNNWTYTWGDLPKESIAGESITYSIYETPVDGYFSELETVEPTDVTYPVWELVDRSKLTGNYVFATDAKYVLVSSNGALGTVGKNHQTNTTTLDFHTVDLSDPQSTPAEVIWTAGSNSANARLSNNSSGYYLGTSGDYFVARSSYSDTYTVNYTKEGYLKFKGSAKYFTCLGTGSTSAGKGVSTDNTTAAVVFDLYKWVNYTVPNADICFLLRNTKYRSDNTMIGVDVEKVWEGRRNGTYPSSVKVTLLQNGNPYGAAVTLNSANNWSYSWDELPSTVTLNGSTVDVVYTIQEDVPSGYTATLEKTTDEFGNVSFVLTNTWMELPLKIHKADLNSTTTPLAGAEFDLYIVDSTMTDSIPGTSLKGECLSHLTSDASGSFGEGFNISLGETYYLVETKAPAGYNLLTEAIGFTTTKSGSNVALNILSGRDWTATETTTTGEALVLELTVYNKSGYQLPLTGGMGTGLFTLVGGLLVVGSGLLLLRKKSKRVAAN